MAQVLYAHKHVQQGKLQVAFETNNIIDLMQSYEQAMQYLK